MQRPCKPIISRTSLNLSFLVNKAERSSGDQPETRKWRTREQVFFFSSEAKLNFQQRCPDRLQFLAASSACGSGNAFAARTVARTLRKGTPGNERILVLCANVRRTSRPPHFPARSTARSRASVHQRDSNTAQLSPHSKLARNRGRVSSVPAESAKAISVRYPLLRCSRRGSASINRK